MFQDPIVSGNRRENNTKPGCHVVEKTHASLLCFLFSAITVSSAHEEEEFLAPCPAPRDEARTHVGREGNVYHISLSALDSSLHSGVGQPTVLGAGKGRVDGWVEKSYVRCFSA